jgi:hypothetical protein
MPPWGRGVSLPSMWCGFDMSVLGRPICRHSCSSEPICCCYQPLVTHPSFLLLVTRHENRGSDAGLEIYLVLHAEIRPFSRSRSFMAMASSPILMTNSGHMLATSSPRSPDILRTVLCHVATAGQRQQNRACALGCATILEGY